MTEEKLNLYGYYVGKEFVKKGIKKKEGEEDKPWTMFRILVKKELEAQYPVKLTAFDSLKGLKDLEEGSFVKVGYIESEPKYNANAKREIKYKSAIWISPAKPEDVPQQSEEETTTTSTLTKPDLEQFESFKKKYLQVCKENKKEPNSIHFFGSYIAATEYDRVAELLQKCEEAMPKQEEVTDDEEPR